MCKSSFEYRLESLGKLNDILRVLNNAQKRYLVEPGNDSAYKEIRRLQKEYQVAAAALHHAVENIE